MALLLLLFMEAVAAPKNPPDGVGAAVAAPPPKGDGVGPVPDEPPKTELALVAAPAVELPNTDELAPNTPPPAAAAEDDVVVADAPNTGGLAAAPGFIPKAGVLPPAATAPNDGVVPLPAAVPPNVTGLLLLVVLEPLPNTPTAEGVAFAEAPKLKVVLLLS